MVVRLLHVSVKVRQGAPAPLLSRRDRRPPPRRRPSPRFRQPTPTHTAVQASPRVNLGPDLRTLIPVGSARAASVDASNNRTSSTLLLSTGLVHQMSVAADLENPPRTIGRRLPRRRKPANPTRPQRLADEGLLRTGCAGCRSRLLVTLSSGIDEPSRPNRTRIIGRRIGRQL